MRKLTLLLTTLLLTSVKGFAAPDDAIVFKDAAVEKICVENWDTTGDGKLSYAEAAAVTSLNRKFEDNKEIVSFNEFQYFTAVTETLLDFSGATALTEITTPSSLEYLNDYTFNGCSALTSVVLNEGLKKIGNYCFENCNSIESIDLPESITDFEANIFKSCKGLTSITVPSRVKLIGMYDFAYCSNLKEVILGEGVETIEESAFKECYALQSINIPAKVETIKENAFDRCTALQKFTVDDNNLYFAAPDGSLYSHDLKVFIAYALGSTNTEYELNSNVSAIKSNAFSYAPNLVSVVIPNNVTEMGERVFESCSKLENVKLPDNINCIPARTFWECENLTSIVLPSKTQFIFEKAFSFCSNLQMLTLPESLISIEQYAFLGTSISKIFAYSKTGNILGLESSEILSDNNNIRLFVPKGCDYVYMDHPYWGKAENILEMSDVDPNECISFLDENVATICYDNWEVDGDGLFTKAEAAAVTSLDNKFRNNPAIVTFNELKYFTGLTTLESEFENATSLTEITTPSSMKSIGNNAFGNCESLVSVTLNEGIESLGTSSIEHCTKLANITLPESIVTIGISSFLKCSSLEEISIPSKVKEITTNTFGECTNLKKLSLPSGLEVLKTSSFSGCLSLKSVYLPETVRAFEGAFNDCTNLAEINVDANNAIYCSVNGNVYLKDKKTLVLHTPGSADTEYTVDDNVNTISKFAFYHNDNLIKIVIPESVDSIGRAAFAKCSNLVSVSLPKGLKYIDRKLFNMCLNLKEIEIPQQIEVIDGNAFDLCSSLENVSLPESLKRVGSGSFNNCPNLKAVYVYSKTGDIEGLEYSGLIDFERTIYVPAGCLDVYKNHAYWGNAKEIKEMQPAVEIIEFEDAKVEEICVANWDADGDGKLNTAEAAAVTSLGGKFAGNTEINSFNEFKYFTGVTETAVNEFTKSDLVSITLPESMKVLGNNSFSQCYSLKNVVLNAGLEKIGDNCFEYTDIEGIDVPDNVNSIGEYAFTNCINLKSFKMPANCNVMADCMFLDCYLLESVALHDNVTSLGNGVFNYSGIKTFHFGKNLQSVNCSFVGCENLESFTVDADNQWFATVGNALYSKDGKTLYNYCIGSKGTEYTVAEGVELIKSNAFEGSKLTNISLPDSLTTIEGFAFSECSALESIVVPEGVTEIGWNTFASCKNLKSVTYSSEMKVLGLGAFSDCSKLEKIVLPETLTEMNYDTFLGCTSLNEIVSYSKTGEFKELENSGLIPDGDNMRVVYVPEGCKAVYEADAYWANAHEIIEMKPTSINGINGADKVMLNGIEIGINGKADIYSVEGVLVKRISAEDNAVNLPAGVYVVNGKKIVVR